MGIARAWAVWREAVRQERKRPRVDRTREEAAFLPAAIEIMETPPNPVGRILLWSVIGFVGIALAWSWCGQIDIVAVAQGRLIPTERLKLVQAPEIGVVRRIHVAEGQRVQTGDVLVELDATISGADRERLAREVLAAGLDRARLEAELADPENPSPRFVPPRGAPAELVEAQLRQMQSETQRFRAQLAGLDEEARRREAQVAASRSQVAKLEAVLPLVRENVEAIGKLSAQGYASKLKHNELRERLVATENDLVTEMRRLDEASAGLQAVREQRRLAEQEFRAQAAKELNVAREKQAGAEQELVKATQRTALQVLRAPVDGTVHQLAAHTVGGVVQPAEVLMAIVPADGRLEVEAQLLNKDVGFVRPGQVAAIKLDAFPYPVYGALDGTVSAISADAVMAPGQPPARPGSRDRGPAEAAAPGPVFVARIALARTTIVVNGAAVDLVPGMAAAVEIRTGTRRVLQFLLDPIARYRDEAGRER